MLKSLPNLHDIEELRLVKVSDSVVLRSLAADDAPRILEILEADPEIRKRVAVAKIIHTKQDVYREIEDSENDPTVIRYSVLKNGKYIGLVTFWRLDDYLDKDNPKPYTFGFGYFLDPAERGNGIIPAALQTLMQVARETLKPQNFMAFCEDDNPASIAVLNKCGFAATDEVVYFPEMGCNERKYVMKA